jgi:quinol monooxygenase YgiN
METSMPEQAASPMIIVSGALYVDEGDRASYLAACQDLIGLARSAEGCLDFHLTADPVEPDRINVYEQWESVDAVESFRGSGTGPDLSARIRGARVAQHEVATTTWL